MTQETFAEPAARDALLYPAPLGIPGDGQAGRMTAEAATRLDYTGLHWTTYAHM